MGLIKGIVWRDAPAKDDNDPVPVMPLSILRIFFEVSKAT